MPLWTRIGLSKVRSISDGELLHLLAPPGAIVADPASAEVYANLKDCAEQSEKAATLYLLATLLAVLAYFNVLEKASAGGLEVARAAFRPVALMAWSASALLLAARFARLAYVQQWFDRRFQSGNGNQRATLLLRYPRAFWYFAFYSGARQWPPDMFPKRMPVLQLVPILLMLAALGLWMVMAVALWVALAIDIWRAAFPSPLWAACTLVVSAILMMLAATGPQYGWKRRYVHYGLSNLLQRLPEDRRQRAFLRIASVQQRMQERDAPLSPDASATPL